MSILNLIFGYAFATVGGAIFLHFHLDKGLWLKISEDGGEPKGGEGQKRTFTMELGILERFVYVSAILASMPGWVAIWLGIKSASQWSRWTGEDRVEFNVFLIGNLFSIVFAFLGAWIADGKITEFIKSL